MEIELSQKSKRSNDLHPFVQVLSISDLDGCVAVENAAFPEDQRASREKVCVLYDLRPSLFLPDRVSLSDTQRHDSSRSPPAHK